MKKEVSCRVLQILFDEFRRRNLSETTLCTNVPYPFSYLHNAHERIEWDVFCTIMANMRPYLSDDDFIKLGYESTQTRLFPAARAIARLLFTAQEFYFWLNDPIKGPGRQLFACINATTKQITKNRLIATLVLEPGFQYCREWFVTAKGAFIALPTAIGLQPATVEMRDIERGAEYDIICPSGGGGLSWIRRILNLPSTMRATARELKEANEVLHERYTQLEEARERVQRQAVQLKASYDISQLIHTHLDLDPTLKAIAESLTHVGHFAAATVSVNTVVEGVAVNRFAQAGDVPVDAQYILRELTSHGLRLGDAALWLKPGSELHEAEELLTYLLPTISMEISDALSFKAVNDYRTSLEQKVADRTYELKETIEKLREAQGGRDRFFSNISHEFRTPLTLILGPLESAIEEADGEHTRNRLVMIKQNALKVLDLINQLLDLSKLQSGRMTLTTSRANIVLFIRGIVVLYQSLADRRNITLSMTSIEENVEVYFDKEKVEKIFNNLMMNAFKFTPDGGNIGITLSTYPDASPNGVRIIVADTGPGISPEHLPYIFDRFYQVTDSSTRGHGGTGIGLGLAKELVALHHGTICAHSVVGKGSEFIVELPLGRNHLKDEDIVEPELPAPQPKQTCVDTTAEEHVVQPESHNNIDRASSPLILIADDNPEVNEYIKENLSAQYQTIIANDGEEGFEKATEHIPDLIISDVMMPRMNGMELCRALKRDVRTSHIPVILLTARASSDSIIEGLETGADDYITKPFDSKELLARVKNLIEQRKHLRSTFSATVALKPGEVAVTSLDDALLKKIMEAVEKNMGDENYGVDNLAQEACLSRRQLYRKLHALTNLPPAEFIQYIRLQRGKELLEKNAGSIAEIAFQVGFGSPSYFSSCFRERFGYPPSEVPRRP